MEVRTVAKVENKRYMSDLEALYQQHVDGQTDDVRTGVLVYRTRTIKSGDMLEVMAYPVFVQKNAVRAARENVTKVAQQKINMQNAVRRVERLVHANFGKHALFVTCTYGKAVTEEVAAHELDLYLQRLRRSAKRDGQELKYVAVTEVSSTGKIHHHMLLEGVDREVAEGKWRKGFTNVRKYQKNEKQFVGLVRYMLKWRSTQESAACGRIRTSQGLKRPVERVSDHKISIRRMERIAEECNVQGVEILQKMYKGYFAQERPEIKRSEYLPGAYMYARMWKEDSPLM
jgi:hypothetical protein